MTTPSIKRHKGVSQTPATKKWTAMVLRSESPTNKQIHIGTFPTKEEAIKARKDRLKSLGVEEEVKGVTFSKANGKWVASVYLGNFKTKEEATDAVARTTAVLRNEPIPKPTYKPSISYLTFSEIPKKDAKQFLPQEVYTKRVGLFKKKYYTVVRVEAK